MAPEFSNENFQNRALPYNVSANSNLCSRQVLDQRYKILHPEDAKQSKSLKIFKNKIKKGVNSRCSCRLCGIYLQNIGLL